MRASRGTVARRSTAARRGSTVARGTAKSGRSQHGRPRAPRSYGTRSAVLLVVFLGLLFTAVYPMQRYFDFRHHIVQLDQQQRALTVQSRQLEQEKKLLLSPAEVERRAREQLGMVKPGEVPFAIVTPGAAAAQPSLAAIPPLAPRGSGLFSRWWNAVSGAFRSAF